MVHWIIGLKKSLKLYTVAFSSHTQLLKFMQVDGWAYLGLEFCQGNMMAVEIYTQTWSGENNGQWTKWMIIKKEKLSGNWGSISIYGFYISASLLYYLPSNCTLELAQARSFLTTQLVSQLLRLIFSLSWFPYSYL